MPAAQPASGRQAIQSEQPFQVAGIPNPNKHDPNHMYYAKPAGFCDRDLCGAPVKSGKQIIGWCAAKVGTCNHCGSWCVAKGYACPSPRVREQPRCRMHGGKSPVGPGSPQFKHGRYSKLLPKAVKNLYLKELRDPEMLSNRDEIAMLGARLQLVTMRLSGEDSSKHWKKVLRAWREFLAANATKAGEQPDKARIDAAGHELNRLIVEGASAEERWDEFSKVAGEKSKMQRVEQERMVTMHSMITIDEFLAAIAAFTDAIHRHVKDDETKRGLSQEILAITGGSVRG